ncbi:MAG: DUF4965 domain-containing protein [Isosphaeraceae bacterium]
MMRRIAFLSLCWLGCLGGLTRGAEPFRPPAIPLIQHDPYFAVWSNADHLTDDVTRHWTGAPMPLVGLVRIDGKTYRVLGDAPRDVPVLEQKSVEITPTRTTVGFANAQVHVDLSFLTPALPDDLDLMARPVTYVSWTISSRDGKPHEAAIFLSASSRLAVHDAGQRVRWERAAFDEVRAVKLGTVEQPVLERRGDQTRIDWGHLYLASSEGSARLTVGAAPVLAAAFVKDGQVPEALDADASRASNDREPALALATAPGKSAAPDAPMRSVMLIAYDDDRAIDFMGQALPAYWKRNGQTIGDALKAAARDRAEIVTRCREFDDNLTTELETAGGARYAQLTALAHRQSLAGSKLAADANGMPLWFPKENTSNGCIGTVDVIYPQIPHLLLLNVALAKASVAPVLEYAASPRWKFPFAPHDLGTYPAATGQVYGGGERTEENQMPVEESGNLLIIAAAIAVVEGNPDFANRYWPQLTQWAKYCEEQGFDPANQLCTDDFAGHLARNANLSIKAILGLASYGKLAGMRGDQTTETRSIVRARVLARKWMTMADAGDHYRLTFDPGKTWSQKYNLVWDRLLGLDIFPPEVAKKELAYYATVEKPFGLPLDSRKAFTKSDWLVWTATLAKDKATFAKLVDPLWKFVNETKDRVPFSDYYWTDSGKNAGMYARPVIGGVFIRLLADQAVWTRWAGKAPKLGNGWAPLPKAPTVVSLVPDASEAPATWRYVTKPPATDWTKAEFDDASWREGQSGFGTADTPGARVHTRWDGPDIWLRRSFELADAPDDSVRLRIHHDEDAEVFINGVRAARLSGFTTDYRNVRLAPEALRALVRGKNVIAIHCHQTGGGQYVDAGFVRIEPPR